MSVILWVLGALAAGVIADEFLGWVTPVCRLLLRRGAHRLPSSWRERYAEEWQAELLALPDAPITRLTWTGRTLLSVRTLRRTLAGAINQDQAIVTADLPSAGFLTITEPTARRLAQGLHLRRLREARGIDPDTAAATLRIPRADFDCLERGRAAITEEARQQLIDLYAVTDQSQLTLARHLALHSDHPGWWHQQAELPTNLPAETLEESATLIRSYDTHHIPGLLQTAAYARTVLLRGRYLTDQNLEEFERTVDARLARRKVLTREAPTRLWAVIDSAALRRPVGGPAATREQLHHLIEVSHLPNVTLQIRPEYLGSAGASGAFRILRFPYPDVPDVIHVDQLTGSLYMDRPHDLDMYTDEMERLAIEAAPANKTRDILHTLLRDLES